ncbi:ParB/RepB/Spo0J family partition protein [Lysobacter sp. Hz 25]|uniref:ParB/RepB/Spo0J family partition protein n=1 Tax=Lysobacter sp. Hz 25 TaxID=3383698 RepID=UPI0038D43A55
MSLPFHPLCLALPDMSSEAFKALVEDVRRNGQLRDIVLHEGMILDGRHRYRACLECGTEPRMVEFSGGDPIAFVISENVARRHLSESQRAMVAAHLASLEKGQTLRSANLPISPVTQPQAAEMLGVSERTVRKAQDVRKSGTPTLVTKVEAGDITVSEAAKIASLGPKSQDRIVQIEDKRERQYELTRALNISQGRKHHSPRTDFIEPVKQSAWLVTFMARLESLIQCAADAGIEPSTLLHRLLAEADWKDPRFAERYGRAAPWMIALGELPDTVDVQRRSA